MHSSKFCPSNNKHPTYRWQICNEFKYWNFYKNLGIFLFSDILNWKWNVEKIFLDLITILLKIIYILTLFLKLWILRSWKKLQIFVKIMRCFNLLSILAWIKFSYIFFNKILNSWDGKMNFTANTLKNQYSRRLLRFWPMHEWIILLRVHIQKFFFLSIVKIFRSIGILMA